MDMLSSCFASSLFWPLRISTLAVDVAPSGGDSGQNKDDAKHDESRSIAMFGTPKCKNHLMTSYILTIQCKYIYRKHVHIDVSYTYVQKHIANHKKPADPKNQKQNQESKSNLE